jgi:hypothetical protein
MPVVTMIRVEHPARSPATRIIRGRDTRTYHLLREGLKNALPAQGVDTDELLIRAVRPNAAKMVGVGIAAITALAKADVPAATARR